MADVTIYSTPTCQFCRMAKDYFNERGVEYKEHDVSTDIEARKDMIDKSGQMGVPVIIINGEMVIGFDQERVESLLESEK